MVHTVVVHLKNSTILRGYYHSENSGLIASDIVRRDSQNPSAEHAGSPCEIPVDLPTTMSIELQDGSGNAEIALQDAKAVFFVRSFAGSPKQQDVRFFDSLSIHPYLWVRMTFQDGEIMEGRVSNGIDLLTQNAFRLFPVDELTNNRCLFVPKQSLKSFQIIGLLEQQMQHLEVA
ncbi:MAG TPA: hypothetical protein VFN53_13035 [Acidobacteriaceae bacterium]|nr:hypothetical protein [Acidobacteriaceae bacterium]